MAVLERGAKGGTGPDGSGGPGEAAAGSAARRRIWLRRGIAALLAAAAVSALAAAGVPRLNSDASVDLLADAGSQVFRDEVLYASTFGGDPIIVELEPAPGQSLLTPEHMVGMAGMEGRLASAHGVKRVYGPGTLVNTFANTVTQRALDICAKEGKAAETKAQNDARAAGRSAQDQAAAGQQAFAAAVRACADRLVKENPTLSLPAVDNPGFYGEILLEPGGQRVRPFWVWALPDLNHAVIQVRMAPDATPADVRAVLDRIDSQSKRKELSGLHAHVTGGPALAVSLADSVQRSLLWLLPVTLLAMLLVSALAIQAPLRLIAVPLAAVAGLWTAGLSGWLGLPLTPATLAVLPVVLGLTTDYVIQTVNRLAEEAAEPGALRRTAASILPATGIAAAATAVAVLAFALSPVPLVRQFALFMALGVGCSYAVSVIAGLPLIGLLAARRRTAATTAPSPLAAPIERAAALPLRAAVALAGVGILGWAALPFVHVETDPGQLMPAGSAALAEAQHVQHAIGLVGELDLVVVSAHSDVTAPELVSWLESATTRATSSDLRPLSGLSGFLAAFDNGKPPDAATTKLILERIPGYFTSAVVSADHRVARSVFGVPRLTSVEEDRALVARLDQAGAPPAGYRAYPAGLAVLAATALAQLQQDQLRLNLLALGIVVAVLLAAYRRPLPALLAVLPTVVAAGWAAALLAALRVSTGPITVLLAGVVVAFATEFSVLWLSRYLAERRSGTAPEQAAQIASRRVGPAIAASALALVIGFLVLVISPVPMVRDFGLVCGIDLAFATGAVLTLLPPMARAWLR